MWRRVASSLSPIISSSPSSRSLSRNQVRRFPLRFSIPIARIFGFLWILTQFITYSRQLLGSLFENHLQRRLVNRYVHIKRSCSFLVYINLFLLVYVTGRRGEISLHYVRTRLVFDSAVYQCVGVGSILKMNRLFFFIKMFAI